jgi:signal recognition particle GTPase
VFTSLSDRLTATFKNLRGKGRLSESDVNATIRDIRVALLDADVALPVVREFTGAVRERALGAEVSGALNPAQQIVKIVNEELVTILGGQTRRSSCLPVCRVLVRPPWPASWPNGSRIRATPRSWWRPTFSGPTR